jgi:SAM-dependent methyltransferase
MAPTITTDQSVAEATPPAPLPAAIAHSGPLVRRRADGRQERLRLLVALASYGEKNLAFLKRNIATYQAMAMEVDVVVVSEAPKNLPESVRVVAGLPSENPWSLPFAHKPIFAESVDRYDLFIYSEDDIELTEEHVRAFLGATELLAPDEIAGFLRYEKDASGTVWMPDAHGAYRWKPESVVHRGALTFAEYTNEHAALYIITQAQLKRAIASGGFLRAPYEARHDMLCAAATDPYTSCGFRKMICVSHLDRFLVHHMSDRYAGALGQTLEAFKDQVRTVEAIGGGAHPATTLCEVESKMVRSEWSKDLYEKPNQHLLGLVPSTARTVLSVGCGSGATERELSRRGMEVTALPLDSVIGAEAARHGIAQVYGRLDECFARLRGRTFDCVLIPNLLHLQRDPGELFEQCARFVGDGGTLVIDSPNFDRLPVLAKRTLGRGNYKKLRTFTESGVNPLNPAVLRRSAGKAGLSRAEVRWYGHALPKAMGLKRLPVRLGRLTANGWVFSATRTAAITRNGTV